MSHASEILPAVLTFFIAFAMLLGDIYSKVNTGNFAMADAISLSVLHLQNRQVSQKACPHSLEAINQQG